MEKNIKLFFIVSKVPTKKNVKENMTLENHHLISITVKLIQAPSMDVKLIGESLIRKRISTDS